MNFYQRMGILPLKKRVNRDKCSFATKQRMFGVFAIEEPGSPVPALYATLMDANSPQEWFRDDNCHWWAACMSGSPGINSFLLEQKGKYWISEWKILALFKIFKITSRSSQNMDTCLRNCGRSIRTKVVSRKQRFSVLSETRTGMMASWKITFVLKSINT